jgi:uncharacterized damage-inducible protein DinB
VTQSEARIERLQRTVQRLLERVERLSPAVLYRAPQAGEWPVMSTLAHLSELLPYWAEQAALIARSPGTAFGRTHDDPDRLGAVEQHGRDTLADIAERIRTSLEQCVGTLRGIPPEAWTRSGQHARRGSMTVQQVVDEFVVAHAEEHAAQVEATLAALDASGTPQQRAAP